MRPLRPGDCKPVYARAKTVERLDVWTDTNRVCVTESPKQLSSEQVSENGYYSSTASNGYPEAGFGKGCGCALGLKVIHSVDNSVSPGQTDVEYRRIAQAEMWDIASEI